MFCPEEENVKKSERKMLLEYNIRTSKKKFINRLKKKIKMPKTYQK